MLQSEQMRAARGLLGWSQAELARVSRIGLATIQRIESRNGQVRGNISTLLSIQEAFEHAGIQFIEADSTGGIGLRLQPKGKKQKSSMR
jgi:transcriptional regulator with XRE-family HTH domain